MSYRPPAVSRHEVGNGPLLRPKMNAMCIPRERFKTMWLVRERCTCRGREVEIIIPPDDSTKPCYESETVQLVPEIAELGDTDWLEERGQVYEIIGSGGRTAPARTA